MHTSLPDSEPVRECLAHSESSNATRLQALRYPDDAEEHFYALQLALATWKQKWGHRYPSFLLLLLLLLLLIRLSSTRLFPTWPKSCSSMSLKRHFMRLT